MDIKLKSITRSWWLKTSVFIVSAITISLALTILIGIATDNRYDNALSDTYESSYEFTNEQFTKVYHDLCYMLDYAQGDITTNKGEFEKYKNRIDGVEGLNYIATDKINTYTRGEMQTVEEFMARDNYFIIRDGSYETNITSTYMYYNINREVLTNNKDKVIAISYDDKIIEADKILWQQHRSEALTAMPWVGGLLIVGFIGLIYLIIVTGKRKDEDVIILSGIDKIWTEIILFAGFVLLAMCVASSLTPVFNNFLFIPGVVEPTGFTEWSAFYFTLAFLSVWVSCGGIVFLSLVRKIKGKIFFKSSFCYFIIKNIRGFIIDTKTSIAKSQFLVKYAFQKKLFVFQKIFLGIEVFLGFIIFIGAASSEPGVVLFFGLIALAVFIGYFYIHRNIIIDAGKLIEQIERIKGGELSASTDIQEDSALYLPSKQLQEIGDGLKNSLEKSLKSERLKVDLVTNMSHDIKTPLTSIINYVDLLEKEEGLPPHVQDYIKILTQKSDRLKNMVQDLFELSKATSGNIEIDMERLDYVKLIEQVLADFNENILKSELDFRVNIPEQSIYILADSKKMYRIFQNLLTNALKYSLLGTRVYINLKEDGILTIKNTANYDMNFSEEEITERFTRGDVSRNTEGSGLGLSIVQSYVEACGGSMKITKDADLFTVTIIFNLVIQ